MSIRRIPALVLAITLLALLYGGATAWAQCPASTTSPNYIPDFSSVPNQNCLTLNGTPAESGYPGFYAPAFAAPPPPSTPNPAQPAPANVTTVLRLTANSGGQAGSAFFTAQQPVAGSFSTTFTFQLSATTVPSLGPADGIAFVIQNSAVNALGGGGGGIGFDGMPSSVAVEFNTFNNGPGIDPSSSDVTIQNCGGTSANSVDESCSLGLNDLTQLPNPITLSDGYVHAATITYTPSSLMNCGPNQTTTCSKLDVILDNIDLFPNGVLFNISTIGLNSGNAWVGFTAATGGGNENQDILSWTFTPQAQTAVVSTTSTATLSFPNAAGNNVYDYTAKLTQSYPNPEIQVQPILMTQAACDSLVDRSFAPARCFVYENAENTGMAASVMLALTCPTSPGGTCGSAAEENFFATLGTDFQFEQSENPLFIYPGIFGPANPFPGFLRGVGPDPLHPCTPPASGPLFTSNQIETFYIDGGHTTGGSGGQGSCWVATYDTPGELPPGITVSSPTFTTYTQNQMVTAKYTCSNPVTSKNPMTSATGPYLTVASCTQSELPAAPSNTNSCLTAANSTQTCTGPVDTSTLGLHTFLVTAIDSGGNQNVFPVVYTVKKH